MRILPMNNVAPSHKARLPKIEVESFIKSSDNVPKLYTLLDLLDKHAGKVAKFTTEKQTSRFLAMGHNGSFYPTSTYNTLYIDNVEIKRGINEEKLEILHSAMTDYQTKDGNTIPMPQSVFDKMWWENRDKTVEDVRKFILEV